MESTKDALGMLRDHESNTGYTKAIKEFSISMTCTQAQLDTVLGLAVRHGASEVQVVKTNADRKRT